MGAAWNVPVFVGEFGASHDAVDALALHDGALRRARRARHRAAPSGSTASRRRSGTARPTASSHADGTEYPVAHAVVRPFARAVAGAALHARLRHDDRHVHALVHARSPGAVTEVSLPARAYPSGFDVDLEGGCYDATHAGELLIQAEAGAKQVSVEVTPKK